MHKLKTRITHGFAEFESLAPHWGDATDQLLDSSKTSLLINLGQAVIPSSARSPQAKIPGPAAHSFTNKPVKSEGAWSRTLCWVVPQQFLTSCFKQPWLAGMPVAWHLKYMPHHISAPSQAKNSTLPFLHHVYLWNLLYACQAANTSRWKPALGPCWMGWDRMDCGYWWRHRSKHCSKAHRL